MSCLTHLNIHKNKKTIYANETENNLKSKIYKFYDFIYTYDEIKKLYPTRFNKLYDPESCSV